MLHYDKGQFSLFQQIKALHFALPFPAPDSIIFFKKMYEIISKWLIIPLYKILSDSCLHNGIVMVI